MQKDVAIKFKLWRRRPKPPVSAAEMRILRKSATVIKKFKRVEKMAGIITRTRVRTRTKAK